MPVPGTADSVAFLGNVGTGELLVVLVLALIVLGPDKLPEAARKVGTVMRDMRRLSQSFRDEVRHAVDLKELEDLRQTFSGDALTGSAGPSLPPLPDQASHGAEARGDVADQPAAREIPPGPQARNGAGPDGADGAGDADPGGR